MPTTFFLDFIFNEISWICSRDNMIISHYFIIQSTYVTYSAQASFYKSLGCFHAILAQTGSFTHLIKFLYSCVQVSGGIFQIKLT